MNMTRAHVCDITQIGRRLYPFRWVNLLFSKFHVVLQISEELQKRFPSCSEELVEELANHLFRFVLQDSQRKCQLLLYVLCVSFFPFHGVKVPVLVRRGSRINTDRFPTSREVWEYGSPGNVFDVNSPKSPFLGF